MALFDPRLSEPCDREHKPNGLNGTSASLGVLMGHVFRRSSGRGWRLRVSSMRQWPHWIEALQPFAPDLTLQTPLLQLAADSAAVEQQQQLVKRRPDSGLELIDPEACPLPCAGGLQSNQDGRIDPLTFQRALREAINQRPIRQKDAKVCQLSREQTGNRSLWRLDSSDGDSSLHAAVVICSALDSAGLLEPLGHVRPMTPVLGQVLALELDASPPNWNSWPAVLAHKGFNLIPTGPRTLLLGATLEPGEQADPSHVDAMQHLLGAAPEWIKQAKVSGSWCGLRARPVDRAAPLLEILEPGLLLATGHYRNGVLLTPATAEWINDQLVDLK